MLEKVRAFIDNHQLLPGEGEIVVGVSGGADSLCLLHLLRRLCGPGLVYPGVTLRAAHLNHQLRGAESAEDARVVAQLAEEWGIPFTGGCADVAELARAQKRSLEDAARQARYAFLRGVAGGRPIAVAHHADDQAETLLLHWLRGSGLNGLVGMQPRQQEIIRPLLAITRAEILAYCAEHDITPVEDQSNSDPRFLRNRLRHEVLPLLQELNPAVRQTLLRNAEVLRVDLEWLEKQVDSHWQSVVIGEQSNEIRLDIHALLRLPLSLQRHLLRRASAHICEGQSPLEPRHQLAIEQQLSLAASSLQERELHLPGQLRALFQAGELLLRRQLPGGRAADPAYTGEVELPVPGEALLPGTPWQVKAEIIQDKGEELSEALGQEDWARVWRLLVPPTPHMVYLDLAAASERLHVRTRRPGDRIQPLGMTAEKKVQDIFVDYHIGRAVRATTPLFFSGPRCLWVAGACLDHRARLTGQTRRILRLSITYTRPAEQ
jgi:tRNA(Ile)-lysidine synthase